MADVATRERFPDLLAVLDATNWEQQKPENFLLNRLSYSAYKHFVAFQALLGKFEQFLSYLAALNPFP